MAAIKKHGHAKPPTPTYRSWNAMKSRCTNPKATAYERYGGRGITVCDRWLEFENFLEDMGVRPEGTTLDRIDNDKGYAPDNCRWSPRIEQQNNRRNMKLYSYKGEEHSLTRWAEITGLPFNTLNHRQRSGWTVEKMLTQPYGG